MVRRLALLSFCFWLAVLGPPRPAMASHQTRGAIDAQQPVPVVFVHGFNATRCSWDGTDNVAHHVANESDRALTGLLASRPMVYLVHYGVDLTNCSDVPALKGRKDPSEGDFTDYEAIWGKVEEQVLKAHEASPTGYVDIVAHSMGGLVSRWYLNHPRARGKEYVRNLIMIATPNHGSFGSMAIRFLGLWRHPDLYELDQDTVDKWRVLYEEYLDYVWDEFQSFWTGLDQQYPSFFDWLAANHPDELDAFSDPSATKPRSEAMRRENRYTGQFEEFMALVLGKSRARARAAWSLWPDYSAILGSEKPVDETPESNLARQWGASGVENFFAHTDPQAISIDRLLPETVPAQVGVDAAGKSKLINIPVNPVIIDLNARDRLRPGLTRYVGIAGTSDDLHSVGTTWLASNLGTYTVQPNDEIVEWNSVVLPLRATDRFYRFDARGWGKENDLTLHSGLLRNPDVIRVVLLELGHYFGTDFRAAAALRPKFTGTIPNTGVPKAPGPLRLGTPLDQTLQTARGTTVLLNIVEQPMAKATPPGQNFSLFIRVKSPELITSAYQAASHQVWLFQEQIDGRATITPFKEESLSARSIWLDPSGLKRVGILTALPAGGTPGRLMDVQILYQPADQLRATIDQAQDRYEVAISQIDSTHFPFMSAFVSVRDKWTGPVAGLGTSDFRLEDTGTEVLDIQAQKAEGRFMRRDKSIVLDLDYSGSMAGNPLTLSQEAARLFIGLLDPKVDQVATLRFSTESSLLHPLTADMAAAKASLTGTAAGSTNIYGSVKHAIQLMAGRQGRKVIILMTDGIHNAGPSSPREVIDLALREGVTIHAVGLGDVNPTELTHVASATGGVYLYAPSAEQLAGLYQSISTQISSEYKLIWIASPGGQAERSVTVGLTRLDTRAEASLKYRPGGN